MPIHQLECSNPCFVCPNGILEAGNYISIQQAVDVLQIDYYSYFHTPSVAAGIVASHGSPNVTVRMCATCEYNYPSFLANLRKAVIEQHRIYNNIYAGQGQGAFEGNIPTTHPPAAALTVISASSGSYNTSHMERDDYVMDFIREYWRRVSMVMSLPATDFFIPLCPGNGTTQLHPNGTGEDRGIMAGYPNIVGSSQAVHERSSVIQFVGPQSAPASVSEGGERETANFPIVGEEDEHGAHVDSADRDDMQIDAVNDDEEEEEEEENGGHSDGNEDEEDGGHNDANEEEKDSDDDDNQEEREGEDLSSDTSDISFQPPSQASDKEGSVSSDEDEMKVRRVTRSKASTLQTTAEGGADLAKNQGGVDVIAQPDGAVQPQRNHRKIKRRVPWKVFSYKYKGRRTQDETFVSRTTATATAHQVREEQDLKCAYCPWDHFNTLLSLRRHHMVEHIAEVNKRHLPRGCSPARAQIIIDDFMESLYEKTVKSSKFCVLCRTQINGMSNFKYHFFNMHFKVVRNEIEIQTKNEVPSGPPELVPIPHSSAI